MTPIEKRIKEINYDLYLLGQLSDKHHQRIQQLIEEKLTLEQQLQQETV